MSVQTVRGELEAADLGRVLMHEHVFVMDTELMQNDASWDEEQRVADAIEKLTELRGRGIDTIVDPTVIGLGRYIPRIQRVNERVDLNIVVATGLYTYNDLPFQFRNVGPGLAIDVPEPLTAMFITDIRDGIANTGVRAGMLKCAIDAPGMTPGVERAMRAVAMAHKETGVPITVHTFPRNRSGLLAQEVLASEGVDLTKVVIGHSGDTADIDYLRSLADQGSLLGMDRFGLDMYLPYEQRVSTIAELARLGYADRMVLAHDASCYIDWVPDAVREVAMPNWKYTHISDDVLPALLERGVSQDQIDEMLIANPRRVFQ